MASAGHHEDTSRFADVFHAADASGPAATLIDVHAHHFGMDIGNIGGGAPRLQVDAQSSATLVVLGSTKRHVPSSMWNVAERLRDLDEASVSHQVISPVPSVMEHAWDTEPSYARRVNESIAVACEQSEGRLIGLGCVAGTQIGPGIDHCISLGLRGIEIGTRCATHDLDAPELAGLWQECAAQDACVFVHPVARGQGVLRRSEPRLDVGLGMPTDTAIAAAALTFGGVLEKFPKLRVALAHGCGSFPWIYPRLREEHLAGSRSREHWDNIICRLFADSLVFDPNHLELLEHRLGPHRLLLGSDGPYLPEELQKLRLLAEEFGASERSSVSIDDLLFGNAMEFLGFSHR